MSVYNSVKSFGSFVWAGVKKWFGVFLNVALCSVVLRWTIEHVITKQIWWSFLWGCLFVNFLYDTFKLIEKKKSEE